MPPPLCSVNDCEVGVVELMLLVLVVTDKLEQFEGTPGCLTKPVGPDRSVEGKGEPLWLELLTSMTAELLV